MDHETEVEMDKDKWLVYDIFNDDLKVAFMEAAIDVAKQNREVCNPAECMARLLALKSFWTPNEFSVLEDFCKKYFW